MNARAGAWYVAALAVVLLGCARTSKRAPTFVERPHTNVSWRGLIVPKMQGWSFILGESIVAKCATEPRFTLTIRKLDERQWALTEFHNSSIAAEMELEGFRDEGTSTGLSGPGVTYGRRIPSKGLDVFVWFCLTDGGLIRGDAVGPSDTQAQLQILFEAGRMVGGIRKFVRGQQADRVGVPEHRA